ncbi:dihydrofolate reductase family protein [Oligoflexus tunisiensis]|uniref:dihydrofolate reductase family protein n=1 Tax=Oligoflexus tunisiensis TaxID=708132 RepID=UPI000B2AFF67|nr:dihydrofolate reductase family protein [Oligoflexus tunisiensis]
MAKLVVRCFTLSLDGFSAARDQSLENPFGTDGIKIMDWALATRTFRQMFGQEGGSTGIDDDFARQADQGIGATIMGRNMFSPMRGPWLNEEWKGWWGPNPPYHTPVFVLTHHPRPSIPMEGGTVFHFVTEGIEVALKKAFEAAKGRDVRLGGGANVIKQYLRAGLIDELHLVLTSKLLGAGERLFEGTDEISKTYDCAEYTASETVTHVRLVKRI